MKISKQQWQWFKAGLFQGLGICVALSLWVDITPRQWEFWAILATAGIFIQAGNYFIFESRKEKPNEPSRS